MLHVARRVYNLHKYIDLQSFFFFSFASRGMQSKKSLESQVRVVDTVGVRNMEGLFYLSMV